MPVHRQQLSRPQRSSNFIVKSVGHYSEWLIDKVATASIGVAPLALVAGIYSTAIGYWLLTIGFFIVTVLAAVGIFARFIAPWQLRVKRLAPADLGSFINPKSQIANRKSIKVVFFSDLHLGLYKRQAWAQRVVDLVNAQSPDLVLIGGDLVGQTKCCDIGELLAPLAGLRAPLGVFATLGNHDHGLPGPDHSGDLAEILPRLGVRLLCNECVRLRDDLRLVGVEEIWADRDDLPRAMAACDDDSGRLLVLGHNPDLMLRIEQDYADLNLDTRDAFFLFGHTHQGQIYLPFAPGAAIPIKSRYYRGVFHTPHGSFYVSSGLGESGTPTRLGTWPEIVVFEV